VSISRRPITSFPPSPRRRRQRRVDLNQNPAPIASLPQPIMEQRSGRGKSRPNAGRTRILRPADDGFVPQAFITRYHGLTNQQKYHIMGAMDVECGHCHALFWQEKHNFMSCCKQGEIVLPPVREPPNLLRRLLTRDYPISDSFFKNIRQYNSALAFISITYIPNRRLGVHAYNPTF
jgi:hypothetical protein